MLIINDTHIGVQRTGGTTVHSQVALKNYVRQQFSSLLDREENHVVINGDLFDGFFVDLTETIKTYEIISDWLFGTNGRITLIMGNHDYSAKADKISSFHLLCHFLRIRFPDQVFVIDHTDGLAAINRNVWAISHCMNQELFNLEIEKAIKEPHPDRAYLLLHCNVKNTFAEHSDHSLNLSDEQLGNLMKAGWTLVVGHEHIGYELRAGRVIVVGNQFPTSVSDCLTNRTKNALVIDEDGHRYVETWSRQGSYCEVDWHALGSPILPHQFFRVGGEATSAEAEAAIMAIAKFRQESSALVITNAIKIAGNEEVGGMTEVSLENVKAFDVMAAIMNELTPEEGVVVRALLQ